MTHVGPRFLDETPTDLSTGDRSSETNPDAMQERPVLLEPRADAPIEIGSDWNPAEAERSSPFRSASALALVGAGVILATWLVFSIIVSLIGFFGVSPGLGVAASALCITGAVLLACAAGHEWRSLRRLHQTEHLRVALLAGSDLEKARELSRAWLERMGRIVPDAAALDASVGQAADLPQLRAVLRNRLSEPLRSGTRSIGIRAASEAGALVALSPHPSWDGLIVAFRGLKVLRQVAELHGLRPGPAVMLALVGRVGRAAAETAAVDLVSQTAADHVFSSVPVLKHLGAISGASTAAFRLYRLSLAAARACSPLAD